jgi:ferritin-like metal-binding protein YciE
MLRKNPFYIMLSNAYEMESALIPLLENQAKDAKNYPLIGKHLKKLLRESKSQAVKFKNHIDSIKGLSAENKSELKETFPLV